VLTVLGQSFDLAALILWHSSWRIGIVETEETAVARERTINTFPWQRTRDTTVYLWMCPSLGLWNLWNLEVHQNKIRRNLVSAIQAIASTGARQLMAMRGAVLWRPWRPRLDTMYHIQKWAHTICVHPKTGQFFVICTTTKNIKSKAWNKYDYFVKN
jgi:hypothetical protein